MLFLNNNRFAILFLILQLFLINTYSQKYTIKIIDAKTKENIQFAHVCFQDIVANCEHYEITNEKGELTIPCANKAVIAVSFVGYNTYTDTINPIQNYTIKLEPTVFQLDQAIVTASFIPQKADQSIYNIKVIDTRKIEEKAATNLTEILSNELNMNFSYDPALGSSMSIKGMSGNNIKILVDGVPVIGRMGGNIDLSQLSLYNIDHIEMVEGPMSVMYGSNALAGAINIITKENKYSKVNANSNLYYETVGRYNLDASVTIKKNKHNFSASLGRNYFNGFTTDTVNRNQIWNPKEQYNGDFYYMYKTERAKIKYSTSIMQETIWDKGNLLAPYYYTALDSWFYTNRLTNRLDYSRQLKNGMSIKQLMSYSNFKREKLTYLKDLSNLTQELSEMASEQDTTNYNAVLYRLEIGEENPDNPFNYSVGTDLNYEFGSGKRILDNFQEVGDFALFGTIKYNYKNKLNLQPGIRVAYNTKFNIAPVPTIHLKWQIIKNLNLRASYARGYRAPNLKELFIYFVDINHNILPNPNLIPETGHNYDLAISWNTEKKNKTHYSNIDFNVFYNDMENEIYLALREQDDGGSPAYKYINLTYYKTLGYQLAFKYNYYPNFDFSAGIGHTGINAHFAPINPALSSYKYSGSFNSSISWNIPKIKVKASANYKYSGKNWKYMIDNEDQISTGYIGQYHNLDLIFLRKFNSNKITLSSGVKNVFNNTDIANSGESGGTHTSGDNSPIGYGRIFFIRFTYNIVQ